MAQAPETVLFLTYGFSTGGAEMIFVNLLNRFSRSRIRPMIVSLAPPAALEKRLTDDLRVIRFARKSKFDLSPVRELRHLIHKQSIQKVLCLGFTSHFFLHRALAGIDMRPRVYISVHTTTPRSLKFALFGHLSSRLVRKDDRLVTVCNSQAEYLAGKYRIPSRQFQTIYNGVETDHWTLPPKPSFREKIRAEFGIPADAPVIIKVAAFRKEKKHEDAVDALVLLRQATQKPAYLLFVGGGDAGHEEIVRQKVRDAGLQEAVKFCGPREDVRPFYWASDLFTLSSVAVETFSMAALEAMATGLPAVLTDIGGAREMVFDGVNGFTVPPGRPDLLARSWQSVLEEPARFPAADISAIIGEKFSLDTCVKAYEELLLGPRTGGNVNPETARA